MTEKMRQALLLSHLKRRLMFCEDPKEEEYVKEEIEKLESKRMDHDSDNRSNSAPVGVDVPLEVRPDAGDVAFIRKVLVDIADVNAELDPIEQIGYQINFFSESQHTRIELYARNFKRFGVWRTGDDKSAFLKIIRGYEPCTSSSI